MAQSKSKPPKFLEVDRSAGELQCVMCQEYKPVLYKVFPWLYCYDCAEAHLRRERFKQEEKEWNDEN